MPLLGDFFTHVIYYFHRRLLQMGVHNTELFTNLGLCCFYAQQYDMSLHCFQKAVELASDENQADVWYNVGHVALVIIIQFTHYLCMREVDKINVNFSFTTDIRLVHVCLVLCPRIHPCTHIHN